MTVLLLGAGPGDPDLLTLRAEAALASATVVVTDTASAVLAKAFAPGAEIVVADESATERLQAAAAGGNVVRLYAGDPWLHPAFAPESAALAAAGISTEAVPGVSVEIGEATAAGRPLHHRAVSVVAELRRPSAPTTAATTADTDDATERLPIDVVGLLGGRPVGATATERLRAARLVAGGRDQLEAVTDLLAAEAETVVVGAGLDALDRVATAAGPVCVLASGDPGFHGIVRALTARVAPERVVVHPAPSSVALAFARVALPWDDAVVASCHRGDAARAAATVAGAPVAAVLCGPAAPPEAVGAELVTLGAHHTTVAVATRLGEPGESVTTLADVRALAAGTFDHRSVVVLAHPEPPVTPTGGRPVGDFAHRKGMITKPEVRAAVLGRLDLPRRGVLWDVGAGSGSVAVEAALAAPGLRVIAIEQHAADADRVRANAAALGAVVEVVEGAAPDALAGLPHPDRVFIGGGGVAVLDACLAAARPGARIVASFAAVDRAVAARERLDSLVQVRVDRAVDLPGGGVRFEADNPVFLAWGDVPAQSAPPDDQPARGEVVVVGLGPGAAEHRTPAATAAVRSADAVIGYGPYVDAAADLLRPDQRVVRLGMGAEDERAALACTLATEGLRVAVVSSGDPGVFAMGATVLAVAGTFDVPVRLVPGVTAAHAAGAAAGAPLGGPHATLTLSDLILPGEVIDAQLRAAAGAGLGIALYNPRSKGRPGHLERARQTLLEHLPPDTPVVVVDAATDPAQRIERSTLAEFDAAAVGMRSVVLVGPGDPRRPR